MKKTILCTLLILSSTCQAINWEDIGYRMDRAAVKNGWLVRHCLVAQCSLTFVPDKDHDWRP